MNDGAEAQYVMENITENSPKDGYTEQIQYME